jgi:hypothetical protein
MKGVLICGHTERLGEVSRTGNLVMIIMTTEKSNIGRILTVQNFMF